MHRRSELVVAADHNDRGHHQGVESGGHVQVHHRVPPFPAGATWARGHHVVTEVDVGFARRGVQRDVLGHLARHLRPRQVDRGAGDEPTRQVLHRRECLREIERDQAEVGQQMVGTRRGEYHRTRHVRHGVGELLRPGQDGHPTHAVSGDQRLAPCGHHGGEDGLEILTEQVGTELRLATRRLAVPTLVVRDHAEAVGEGVDLGIPVLGVAGPAMDQHHQLAVGRTVRNDVDRGAVSSDHLDVLGVLRRCGEQRVGLVFDRVRCLQGLSHDRSEEGAGDRRSGRDHSCSYRGTADSH